MTNGSIQWLHWCGHIFETGLIVWFVVRCQKYEKVTGRLSAQLFRQLTSSSVSHGDRIASWINWDRQQQVASLERQEKRRVMFDTAIRQYEEIIEKATQLGRDS